MMASKGYILRSGCADGSDYAFELGAAEYDPSLTEIYLPNGSFKSYRRIKGVNYLPLIEGEVEKASELYKTPTQKHKHGIIPWFDKMQDYNKNFHARNVLEVTGRNGIDSDVCFYYAPEDCKTVSGGTRSAVELCRSKDIPAHNLYFKNVEERVERYLSEQGF